jgi:amidase
VPGKSRRSVSATRSQQRAGQPRVGGDRGTCEQRRGHEEPRADQARQEGAGPGSDAQAAEGEGGEDLHRFDGVRRVAAEQRPAEREEQVGHAADAEHDDVRLSRRERQPDHRAGRSTPGGTVAEPLPQPGQRTAGRAGPRRRVLAKTNLPEFSFWIESDNLLTGRTNNPWDLDRSSGGSSGGESAAIAAGMSPLGLASDLSISVRGPAADTGVVSLKPTHGRIPMTGIWPREPRRNWHVGPMARSIRDLAGAYSLLTGPDGADGYSATSHTFDTGLGASPDRRVRVGWLVDSGLGPTDAEVAATVEAAAEALRTAGAQVDAVHIPALERKQGRAGAGVVGGRDLGEPRALVNAPPRHTL